MKISNDWENGNGLDKSIENWMAEISDTNPKEEGCTLCRTDACLVKFDHIVIPAEIDAKLGLEHFATRPASSPLQLTPKWSALRTSHYNSGYYQGAA